MADRIVRGEIWMYAFGRPDKQRPVVVIARQEVIALLHTVMVAPVTSAIRGAPSEVLVGAANGLKQDSAVNLDHVQTIDKAGLKKRLGALTPQQMHAVCRALAVAVDCDGGV